MSKLPQPGGGKWAEKLHRSEPATTVQERCQKARSLAPGLVQLARN
jgi:hypothetical protein